MDLGSTDSGRSSFAQEGSASPRDFSCNSESSIELLVTQDNCDGFDSLPVEMGGSSDDTEVCPYRSGSDMGDDRAGSDMGDEGMQLVSSSAERGGAAPVTEMAWISTVPVTGRRKLQ